MSRMKVQLPYKTSLEVTLLKASSWVSQGGDLEWFLEGTVNVFGMTQKAERFKSLVSWDGGRFWVREWDTPGIQNPASSWLMRVMEEFFEKKSDLLLQHLPSSDERALRVAFRHLAS